MSAALKKFALLKSPSDFLSMISADITRITGVQLGDKQRAMVESRLRKRGIDLGLGSLEEYAEYYELNKVEETQALVSLLTTHHTYFFRESSHFEYLQTHALANLVSEVRKRSDKKLRIWSAACSRGQEVYSLAMFLDFHLKLMAPDISWEIIGTDVDPESISIAKNGVYRFDELKKVPMNYLASHWSRGSGEISNFVKAKRSLRERCRFGVANLLNVAEFPKEHKFDIVFCRNVFIYFTPEQVKSISQNLLNQLSETGYFFIGISESLNGSQLKVLSRGPSIYQKQSTATGTVTVTANVSKGLPSLTTASTSSIISEPKSQKPLRVLCVDDSPSIHALLKQILSDKNGFEIVGKAMNGIEASEFLRHNSVDVVTLDMHMPGQGGIEYLEKNFKSQHPAVVVISSVSREDSDIAFRALELGASDFVEKPSLNNMLERGEEIRAKLRSAVQAKALAFGASSGSQKANTQLDRQFSKRIEISDVGGKLRVVALGLQDKKRFIDMHKEFSGKQVTTLLLVEGGSNLLEAFAKELQSRISVPVHCLRDSGGTIAEGSICLADSKLFDAKLLKSFKDFSVLVFGNCSRQLADKFVKLPKRQILIEDVGSGEGYAVMAPVATDRVPVTSFAYMSTVYFSRGDGS